MKKTIDSNRFEIIADQLCWLGRDLTIDSNPHYIASMGEDHATIVGSCGKRTPYQAPAEGQDPMCSLSRIPISSNPDPGSFGQWIRLAA